MQIIIKLLSTEVKFSHNGSSLGKKILRSEGEGRHCQLNGRASIARFLLVSAYIMDKWIPGHFDSARSPSFSIASAVF
jgi:hypothetical protein